uniref:Uncharacterized protein n=1 Tax=Oryza glumipatula TaxID=40148 RepID=A0A0E0A4L2_9ORYZ
MKVLCPKLGIMKGEGCLHWSKCMWLEKKLKQDRQAIHIVFFFKKAAEDDEAREEAYCGGSGGDGARRCRRRELRWQRKRARAGDLTGEKAASLRALLRRRWLLIAPPWGAAVGRNITALHRCPVSTMD